MSSPEALGLLLWGLFIVVLVIAVARVLGNLAPTRGGCLAMDGRGQRCTYPPGHAGAHSSSRLLQSWVPSIAPPTAPAIGDTYAAAFTASSREEATQLARKHAALIAPLGWRPVDERVELKSSLSEGLVSVVAGAGGSGGMARLVVTYEYRPEGVEPRSTVDSRSSHWVGAPVDVGTDRSDGHS